MKELLPIGSIVKLNNVDKELMIFGYYQQLKDFDKTAEYIGVFYPVGHINPLYQIGFQSSDIEKVVFRGYQNEEFESFKEKLTEYINGSTAE